MTNLNIKTALTAVTLAAATFAAPLSAQAADYNRKCNDTSNSVAGGLIGGSVGAAIGEGIAGRGDRTEGAVLGAIIGGIAGAALGDGTSDCEKNDSRNNRTSSRVVTTTSYPTRTVTSNTGYSNSGYNRGYSNSGHNTVYSTVSYGHNSRDSNSYALYKIESEIESLLRERSYLKTQKSRSRHYSSDIKRRLEKIDYSLAQLKREQKLIKKSSRSRNVYR